MLNLAPVLAAPSLPFPLSPIMRPRQTVSELFSTFLQFDGDRVQSWITDARLRRSMQLCLEQAATQESSENFWALYWHKAWQTQPFGLAKNHLTAYSQEPCYWVAQKTTLNFSSTQYDLTDCFQMAIAQIDKVLKGFNSQQGFNFKNYASATFGSLIRETLRQRQEIDICTDWALLRKISQRRLVDALQNAGLAQAAIHSYVLAWTGFRTLYVPTQATATRKLPKPEPATWEAIAQFYNAEKGNLPSPSSSTRADQIEQWLTACARAARAYLYPASVSINTPKPGQESGEFLDDLPEMTQGSLLNDLIAEEETHSRQRQQLQVSRLLEEAIAHLDAESQTILKLYYHQGLTQQQMATQLNTQQYTVSRRLTRAREALLKKLAVWTQETLHISPTSDVLKHTSIALEEWLKTYYSHPDLPTSHAAA